MGLVEGDGSPSEMTPGYFLSMSFLLLLYFVYLMLR